jgi:Spy/CpxP family protein refolding chaperone
MTRMTRFGFAIAVLTLLGTYPLAAQTVPSPAAPRGTTTASPTHQRPCWQQAGISQSAMQQRKQIEENTRSQVESVCSDSSLTPQQKQQKIHQLHQEAQQQVNGLITPQQEAALKSCRESRGEGPHVHVGAARGGGPCSEMTSPGNKP